MLYTKNYIHEAAEPSQKVQVVILANSLDDGTAAKVMSDVCDFNDIECNLIDIDKAYLGESDVELRSVELRNIDGEGKKLEMNIDSTIVFVRGGAIATKAGQAIISSLQTVGFFMVNDLEAMMICDNKMSTTIALNRQNVQTPRTVLLNNVESIEFAHKSVGGKFPVIIKTMTGTQGVGVSKVESMDSLVSVCQSLWKFDAELILQEFLKMDGDYRTLVVDGNILACAHRRQKKENKDFRSNVHLGAETIPHTLTVKEAKIVIDAAKAVGGYFVGVDHAIVNGEVYILEVNGSPGVKSHFMGYDLYTQKKTKKMSDVKTFDAFLQYLLDPDNRRSFFRLEAGFIESIIVEGLEHDPVRAKLDSGNGTNASMFNVEKMKVDEKNQKVHWEKSGKKFTSDLLGISKARHMDAVDERPMIEHNITFNNKKYLVKLGLTLKDTASELLLNRDTIKLFRVAINVNKRFALSDYTSRQDKYEV